MALSGDIAVVGSLAAAAYVFVRGATGWTEQARLKTEDATPAISFGQSVALWGDTAVIGAARAAYVLVHEGTTWSQQAKLIAIEVGPHFGRHVGVWGDTAVVTDWGDDVTGDQTSDGSAYVFARNGGTWSQQAKLTASDAETGKLFGWSVAVSGTTALVGRPIDDLTGGRNRGSAYLFARNAAGWSELVKFTASDGQAFDRFGESTAVWSQTAVVGVPYDDHGGHLSAGSAYVFTNPGQGPNQLPVAFCTDVTVQAGPACTAQASVDSGSFDPDGGAIVLDQSPPGPYDLGTTLVTLIATDEGAASDSCVANLTVEDATPPELTVRLDPDTLWPPHHHMVGITGTIEASDNCGTPTVALASLTSNEPDDAPGIGDGQTTGDTQPGNDDFHFSTRAERAGTGGGRIYTAVYTATDGSDNVASAAGLVVVPHDQGGVTDPVAILLEQSPGGTLVSWATVPGAESYDVIRGELDNVVETDVVINLGTVVCIEANSADESTLGAEDAELPTPGQAFFYLVEYFDGISSTYGSESAGKPRAPGAGACD